MTVLKYEIKSHRSKYYELKVCILIQTLNLFYELDSLETFERTFKEDIKKIPRASNGTAEMFYNISRKEDPDRLEVWHLNINGEPDRLLAIISVNSDYTL